MFKYKIVFLGILILFGTTIPFKLLFPMRRRDLGFSETSHMYPFIHMYIVVKKLCTRNMCDVSRACVDELVRYSDMICQ